ncbi:MAG: hypothetical protein ACOX8V_06220, partial [Thermoleophilia bacterium]
MPPLFAAGAFSEDVLAGVVFAGVVLAEAGLPGARPPEAGFLFVALFVALVAVGFVPPGFAEAALVVLAEDALVAVVLAEDALVAVVLVDAATPEVVLAEAGFVDAVFAGAVLAEAGLPGARPPEAGFLFVALFVALVAVGFVPPGFAEAALV